MSRSIVDTVNKKLKNDIPTPIFTQSYQENDKRYPFEMPKKLSEKTQKALLKRQLIEDGSFGIGVFDPKEDISAAEELLKQKFYVAFDGWVSRNFIQGQGPAAKKLIKQIYPDWFTNRERYVKKLLKLQERIAKLDINDVQSKEDLALKYMLDEGLINKEDLNIRSFKAGDERRTNTFSEYGAREVLDEEQKLGSVQAPYAFPYAGRNRANKRAPRRNRDRNIDTLGDQRNFVRFFDVFRR